MLSAVIGLHTLLVSTGVFYPGPDFSFSRVPLSPVLRLIIEAVLVAIYALLSASTALIIGFPLNKILFIIKRFYFKSRREQEWRNIPGYGVVESVRTRVAALF